MKALISKIINKIPQTLFSNKNETNEFYTTQNISEENEDEPILFI